jgi:hypothetical protein
VRQRRVEGGTPLPAGLVRQAAQPANVDPSGFRFDLRLLATPAEAAVPALRPDPLLRGSDES